MIRTTKVSGFGAVLLCLSLSSCAFLLDYDGLQKGTQSAGVGAVAPARTVVVLEVLVIPAQVPGLVVAAWERVARAALQVAVSTATTTTPARWTGAEGRSTNPHASMTQRWWSRTVSTRRLRSPTCTGSP